MSKQTNFFQTATHATAHTTAPTITYGTPDRWGEAFQPLRGHTRPSETSSFESTTKPQLQRSSLLGTRAFGHLSPDPGNSQKPQTAGMAAKLPSATVTSVQRKSLPPGLSCHCGACVYSIQAKRSQHRAPERGDLMAQSLQQSLQRKSCETGCQCAQCVPLSPARVQRQAETNHAPNCTCPQCSGKMLQPKPLIQPLSNRIQRHAGHDHDEEVQRAVMPGASGVIQRHAGHDHDEEVQRAVMPGASGVIQRHAGHDQDEEMQRQSLDSSSLQVNMTTREKVLQLTPDRPAISVTPIASASTIQRHSSYEHYLLGQVQPQKLSDISMVRDIKNLKSQLEQAKETAKSSEEIEALQTKIKEAEAKRDDVRHTLEQEMARLQSWARNPEAVKVENGRIKGSQAERGTERMGNDIELVGLVDPKVYVPLESDQQAVDAGVGEVTKGESGEWQVPYVVLPARDGQVVATYSEINTLPDMFGNPETMANTPKDKLIAILQGVRQQSYLELDNLYQELFDFSRSMLSRTGVTDDDFINATGPRAQAVVDSVYQIRTESQLNDATKRPGEESQGYFAAIERNACHFAPYSWDAWKDYHEKARKWARESYEKKQAAGSIPDEGQKRQALAEAADLANKAMLYNAFGEHYLQDSFAAGHLIDKTKTMQAFVRWIDNNGDSLGTFAEAKEKWAMTLMVAKSNLNDDFNPQALDDMLFRAGKKKPADFLETAAAKVGLTPTDDIIFLMWWRDAASVDDDLKELTPQKAASDTTVAPARVRGNQEELQKLMASLVERKFARQSKTGFTGWWGETSYIIHDIHVETAKKAKEQKSSESSLGSTVAQQRLKREEAPDYGKEAAEFNLQAYNAFLSNAYVQAATGYFHDKFCKEGLIVKAHNGTDLGRIYGDSNMMKAGGQKGVKYSAETSQMSREVIFEMINGKPEDQLPAVQTIRDRFPAEVFVPGNGGGWKTLANWQSEHLYTNEMFSEAAQSKAKALYKLQEGLSEGHAIDVAGFAKHDGDVF